MSPFDGLLNWIDTLTAAPGASGPALTVIYGLPLNVPVLLTMVTRGVRLVSTT